MCTDKCLNLYRTDGQMFLLLGNMDRFGEEHIICRSTALAV